jgi:hypothetical protein
MLGKKPTKTKKEQTNADYEKLGRQIEAMYDAVNPDRKKLYRMAFLKGIAQGVGGVIGATLVIALLIWLLSLFEQVPFLGHFIDSIQHSLQSRK